MSDDLKNLKRDELDKLAQEAGVPNPDTLPNKDAVVEAIESPNAALVVEPDPVVAQSYTVAGTHEVYGHAPGETFEMLIPADQAELLLQSGALTLNKKEGA